MGLDGMLSFQKETSLNRLPDHPPKKIYVRNLKPTYTPTPCLQQHPIPTDARK